MKHKNQTIKKIKLALTFTLFAFANLNNATAQWSSNPSVNTPIANTALAEYDHESIPDGSGGIIVVWAVSDENLGTDVIKAKRVSASGVTIWGGTNGIQITNSTRNQAFPHLVTDGNGGAIITWLNFDVDAELTATEADVYAQRINASGTLLWGNGGLIINATPGNQVFSSIVSDDASGAIIVWSDEAQEAIYAQRVNANGQIIWAANGKNIYTALITKTIGNSQIFKGINGNFTVVFNTVFEEVRNNQTKTKPNEFYLQTINANGQNQLATAIQLYNFPTDYDIEDIISDNNGGLFSTVSYQTNTTVSLFLQKYSALGIPQFAGTYGLTVDNSIAKSQTYPRYIANTNIITDNTGGALIGWTDVRNSITGFYVQRFNNTGTKLFNANDVSVFGNNLDINSDAPSAIIDSDGNYVYITPKSSTTLGNGALYTQKVSTTGTTLWTAGGVLVSNSAGNKSSPTLTLTGNKMIALWEDFRASIPAGFNSDIYAQTINSNGTLPVTLTTFTALYGDDKVRLNWQTATEINNQGFDIERSTDGLIFSKIAYVKGNGTTNVPQNYNHNDANLISQTQYLYYRLKQVDSNGEFEYSNIVSVKIPQLNNATFSIYPNPVTAKQFNVKLAGLPKGNYQTSITNMAGINVKKAIIFCDDTSNQVVNVDLPKGMYNLEITSANYRQVQKLLVE